MSIKGIFPYILLLLPFLTAFGYEYTPADTANVYFRLGHRQVDPSFADNKEALDRFVKSIKDANAVDDVHHIVVRSSSSPDGSLDANIRLSQNRSDEMVKYLVQQAGIDASLINSSSEGIAWKELRNLVAVTPEVPMQAQVLEIIDNQPEATLKQALVELGGGAPYNWMYKNLFPQLRSAMMISLFRTSYMEAEDRAREAAARKAAEEAAARNAGAAGQQSASGEGITETVEEVVEISATSDAGDAASDGNAGANANGFATVTNPGKNFYMDIRTNMLYDVLALPNIGVDFYIGKNFSIGGNWLYGWWKTDNRHRYWRAYGGELNGRWWFGRKAHNKPLTGHHAGLYAQLYTYDFEWGGKGEMGGKPGDNMWARCFWGVGAEYGFSLPVAKRINIDFTLGVGYTTGTYYKYHPEDGHYVWESTHKRNYVGPTKLEVALVWLLGNGNVNEKKGGKR